MYSDVGARGINRQRMKWRHIYHISIQRILYCHNNIFYDNIILNYYIHMHIISVNIYTIAKYYYALRDTENAKLSEFHLPNRSTRTLTLTLPIHCSNIESFVSLYQIMCIYSQGIDKSIFYYHTYYLCNQ